MRVVGGPSRDPTSAPDTLQLDVTDARRVHTHINTMRSGIKFPLLREEGWCGGGTDPRPPSPHQPHLLLCSYLCSQGVCDQMWHSYKFNKEAGVRLCARAQARVCFMPRWFHPSHLPGVRGNTRIWRSVCSCKLTVCVTHARADSVRVGFPKRLISRLHVSVVNPPRLSRESQLRPFLRLPSSPHHPVTLSSPPPQMGPPFISPQNTNNSHWRIPKRLVPVPFAAPRLNGVMMQEVDRGGERGGSHKQT